MKLQAKRMGVLLLIAWQAGAGVPLGCAYSFNMIVPDVRLAATASGGSACPVRSHQLPGAGAIGVRWSTSLNVNPVTVLTQTQTATGRLNEIEQAINESVAAWTGVAGTTVLPSNFSALTRTPAQSACGADGVNSICFNQADQAFTPGVLAFTRVITADSIGATAGVQSSTELGQILDADIYFNPNGSATYATPQALPAATGAYDLESLLIHELGHLLGFSHSAVWGAILFPYAPAPGTYSGTRPTTQQPDAPLGEDDRTGLRALYPDPADSLHQGTISGRIVPANSLALPLYPPGVTGVFGAQVVAVDDMTGAAVGAAIGGWSCSSPGPAQFDGSYAVERLAVGHTYSVYGEPLNGAVGPSQISSAIGTLCRNAATDAGWPPAMACVVPAAQTSFTTRTRPGP